MIRRRPTLPQALGCLGVVLAVVGLPVPGGDGAAAAGSEPPNERTWTAVELDDAPADRLALAVRPGAIAVAHAREQRQGGGLDYLLCDADCSSRSGWRRTTVARGPYVWQISTAFDPWGNPHLAYRSGQDLVYATCVDACDDEASWSAVSLGPVSVHDRDYGHSTYTGISIGLDEWGRPRIAYVDERTDDGDAGGPALKFASCETACDDPEQWTVARIATPAPYPAQPRLSHAGNRPRIAYTAQVGLARTVFYTACDEHCLGPDQWQHQRIRGKGPSLHGSFGFRLDGDRPRLAVPAEHAGFVHCDAACAASDPWPQPVIVDDRSFAGQADLALARDGPRLVFVSGRRGWLHLAACDSSCDLAGSWTVTESRSFAGRPTIAADGQRLRVAYVSDRDDRGAGPLVVQQCDTPCGEPAALRPAPSGEPPPSTSTHPPTPPAATAQRQAPPPPPTDFEGPPASELLEEAPGAPASPDAHDVIDRRRTHPAGAGSATVPPGNDHATSGSAPPRPSRVGTTNSGPPITFVLAVLAGTLAWIANRARRRHRAIATTLHRR